MARSAPGARQDVRLRRRPVWHLPCRRSQPAGRLCGCLIQFGRYDNRVGSDLGTARYASRVWSASLEGGYAVAAARACALANLVIEPHAQIIHARYRANDATLQDTRMRSGRNRATLLRGGVRLYPGSRPTRIAARSAPLSRPTGCAATRAAVRGRHAHWRNASRNALELKLGMDARDPAHASVGPAHRTVRRRRARRRHAQSFPCLVTGIAGARAAPQREYPRAEISQISSTTPSRNTTSPSCRLKVGSTCAGTSRSTAPSSGARRPARRAPRCARR